MNRGVLICLALTGIFRFCSPACAQGGDITITTGKEADTSETLESKQAKTDEKYFEALKCKVHEDYDRALLLLGQYVQERPEVGAAWFDMARIYADKKQLDKALEAIRKALDADPQNKWFKETYGKLLATSGKQSEAAGIFAELTKAYPKDEEYPVYAAEYYEQTGDKNKALTFLDIAQQRTIDDEEIRLHKVQLLLSMNKIEKAADEVRHMIDEDPRNGKYYKLLGELYDNNKAPQKAREVFDMAAKKLPEDPYVQLGQAGHYLKSGDTVQYKRYLKKAITNRGIESDVQLDLLRAYIQSQPDDSTGIAEALPVVEMLAKQDPTDANVLAFYGEALDASGMRDSALAVYKRCLVLKPSNFQVWGRLMAGYLDKPYADSLIKYSEKALRLFPSQAITHFYNGIGHMYKNEYAAAIRAMGRAIDLQPDTEKDVLAQMHSTIADVYYSNKQYTLSDENFGKALKLDPDNANTLNNYAYYLSERGVKLDEAEQMSKKSLDLRPNEATFLDTYGWILYKKGDFSGAKTWVEKAIDAANGKDDATLYNHLGNILFKLNERTKAVDAWKTAKQKGCEDANLDKKIAEGTLYE